VNVIGQKRPGQAVGIGLLEKRRKAVEKKCTVLVVDEDRATFYAVDNDMVQQTGDVEAGGAGPGVRIAKGDDLVD